MHGYMNVDSEPMTFNEVRKLAKQLDIPDFDVMELNGIEQVQVLGKAVQRTSELHYMDTI